MQMIYDAISDERLAEFKKLMEGAKEPNPAHEAERLDAEIRKKRDAAAEEAERALYANRHERRKAKALTR